MLWEDESTQSFLEKNKHVGEELLEHIFEVVAEIISKQLEEAEGEEENGGEGGPGGLENGDGDELNRSM